jgi:hypothetical protein
MRFLWRQRTMALAHDDSSEALGVNGIGCIRKFESLDLGLLCADRYSGELEIREDIEA